MSSMTETDHNMPRIILAFLLLQLPSCRECLVGEETCPELQYEFVRISSPLGTGFTGWIGAYGRYPDCPDAEVRITGMPNDSGLITNINYHAFEHTDSIRIHLERTIGNAPIVIWSMMGNQYDTLSPGVLVYDSKKVRSQAMN